MPGVWLIQLRKIKSQLSRDILNDFRILQIGLIDEEVHVDETLADTANDCHRNQVTKSVAVMYFKVILFRVHSALAPLPGFPLRWWTGSMLRFHGSFLSRSPKI
ncbi:MAG: hypothetical protein DMG96_28300 [Acidobacteria bacterium]|nr:MAG: hypothetical protein DMG96_28300 [Acidobacteriota bacterium]